MKLRLPNKLVAAIMAAVSPVLCSTISTATMGAAALLTLGSTHAEEVVLTEDKTLANSGTLANFVYADGLDMKTYGISRDQTGSGYFTMYAHGLKGEGNSSIRFARTNAGWNMNVVWLDGDASKFYGNIEIDSPHANNYLGLGSETGGILNMSNGSITLTQRAVLGLGNNVNVKAFSAGESEIRATSGQLPSGLTTPGTSAEFTVNSEGFVTTSNERTLTVGTLSLTGSKVMEHVNIAIAESGEGSINGGTINGKVLNESGTLTLQGSFSGNGTIESANTKLSGVVNAGNTTLKLSGVVTIDENVRYTALNSDEEGYAYSAGDNGYRLWDHADAYLIKGSVSQITADFGAVTTHTDDAGLIGSVKAQTVEYYVNTSVNTHDVSGASDYVVSGTLNVNSSNTSTNINSVTLKAGGVLNTTNGNGQNMTGISVGTLTVDGAASLTKKDTWASQITVGALNGEGNLLVDFGADNNTKSTYLKLNGAGNYSGELTLSTNYKHNASTAPDGQDNWWGFAYATFMEIANENAMSNAVLNLKGYLGSKRESNGGGNFNDVATLALNADTVNLAGLKGNQYSYIYSGAAVDQCSQYDAPAGDDTVRTLSINAASDTPYAFSGKVAGNINLTKRGEGTQIFDGDLSAFDGNVTVSGGTLAVNATLTDTKGTLKNVIIAQDATLELQNVNATTATDGDNQQLKGNLTIGDGATFTVEKTDSLWYGATAEHANTITVQSGGTLSFGSKRWTVGANNRIVLAGGTITGTGDGNGALDFYQDGGVLSATETSTISANIRLRNADQTTTFSVADTKTLTVSGVISGSGNLLKNGAGTLSFEGGFSNFAGNVLIAEGTLTFAGQNVTTTRPVTMYKGNLVFADGSTTLGSIVVTSSGNSGTGGVGDTSITIGTAESNATVKVTRIELADTNNTGHTNTLTVNSGSKLIVTGNDNGSDYKTASLLLGEWNQKTTANIAGSLLAKDALLLGGDYGFDVNINGGTVAVKGVGQSHGDKDPQESLLIDNNGKLILGAKGIDTTDEGGKASTSLSITVANGTIGLSAADVTINRPVTITGTATFDTELYSFNGDGTEIAKPEGEQTGGTLTVSGVISGSGALVKDGIGTLVLSGSNTITGNVTVNAGTIVAGSNTALGALNADDSRTITLNSGATLDVNDHEGTGAGYSVTLNGGTLTNNKAATESHNLGWGKRQFVTALTLTADSVVKADSGKDFGIIGSQYAATSIALGNNTLEKTGDGIYYLTRTTVTGEDGGKLKASAGTLEFRNDGGDGSLEADIEMAGGTVAGSIVLGGNIAVTAANASSSFTAAVNVGAHTLTVGGTADMEMSGAVSGNGVIVKDGADTITLSGNLSGFTGAIKTAAGSTNAGTVMVTGNSGAKHLWAYTNGTIAYNTSNDSSVDALHMEGGTIELVGGNTTAANMWSAPAGGALIVDNGATLTVTDNIQFGGTGSTVTVKGNGVFTANPQGVELTRREGLNAETHAELKRTSGSGAAPYLTDSGSYTISHAQIKVNKSANDTISNILTDSVLINASSNGSTLTASNKANTLVGVHAESGAVKVQNAVSSKSTLKSIKAEGGDVTLLDLDADASLSLSELVIGNSKTVTALTEGTSVNQTESNVAAISIADGGKLTAHSGATLNANLTMQSGSTLDVQQGGLSLGCSLTLNNGENFVLHDATVTDGKLENYVLYTGVDSFVLNGTTITDMGWYDAKVVQLDRNIISSITADGVALDLENHNYVFGFWNGAVSLAESTVPEPTTTTLSLLTLAGLAARRRRK